MIVEVPPVSGPRSADRNIVVNANEEGGVYRPSRHLARIKDSFEQQHKDPDAFIRFHGVAQWVGWLWPYAALAVLLARVAARQSD